jgi:crotonobetainyl-CoA:carnitine CoA-transferase CaiB-like acyl-CoA transferase
MMPFSDGKYWPRFCTAVGKPEWIERYGRKRERNADGAAILAELDELFGSWSLQEAQDRLKNAGCIVGAVAQLDEVVKDPQMQASGAIAVVPHPASRLANFPLDSGGNHRTVNAPFTIQGADVGIRGPAPMPGEHTDAILMEVGMSTTEVAELRAAGILRFEPPKGSPLARWQEKLTQAQRGE